MRRNLLLETVVVVVVIIIIIILFPFLGRTYYLSTDSMYVKYLGNNLID